jgi:3-phosphoshikimate 1-carboxyvinyltransferase
VKSCLLFAGLAAEGEMVLQEPGISRDHTERMLRGLGVSVETEQNSSGPLVTTRLVPPRPLALPPLDGALPGDFSSAAFLIVAALIVPGSRVTLQGIGLNPTRTGLLDALQAMGAGVRIRETGQVFGEPAGELLVTSASLRGIDVDGPLVARMIDEFPIFAVAAAWAQGCTTVRGAGELRHKESDRIAAMCTELRKLGVEIVETVDGFEIQGGRPLRGGAVESHGDHRLAMALAVAGLMAEALVAVQGAGVISESFPGFVEALAGLGAGVRWEG